jgi:two-component system phosphate regulon sensor histidine kinase PhoR
MENKKQLLENIVHGVFLILGLITVGCVLLISVYLVISGIPQLLQGIIYNLCDNAIKYNREGGSVTVSVKNEEHQVQLSVVDTGIGIPAEHQERIFERFYRVDKSHSKEIGGTGLGLSIVKHAARLHDASINVHSVVDGGTTIVLRFPKG